jgi:hypothetical protein
MRPVLMGMCRYESLDDGSIGLAGFAQMNDALDVKLHNEALYHEANE